MPRNDLIIKIGADDSPLRKSLKQLNNALTRFGDRLESVGKDMTLRFTAPLVAAGAASVRTFAQFDKLEKGLAAITGSLPEAQKQFGNLLDIVKDTRTTLDLRTAATASLQLQAVGRDARSVENTLRQLGIAATLAGSSGDDVGEVARQLSQAAAKGNILQQELRIILERIPSLAAVIKNEFGTVTAEGLRDAGVSADDFINRLTKAIETNEKFQSVQGGISKAIETFGINLQIAGAELGKTISDTIGLENVLNTVSNTLSSLVQGFAALSPGTKSLILGFAGITAAVGPLTFGIGALSRALPLLRAGIAALTGPVGIVITALGALGAAFLLSKGNSKNATDAFNEQRAKVEELDSTLPALLQKYDELKDGKTEEEQRKLKDVIAQIGQIVPSAVTQFGEYGEALDISTDKAKEFVAAQKLLLQQQNSDAISENTRSLEKYSEELEKINKQLNAVNERGEAAPAREVTFAGTGGIQTSSVELNDGEIRNLQTRAAELKVEINNTTNAVKILKGEFEKPVKEIIEPDAEEKNRDFTESLKEQAKALKDVREQIELADNRYKLYKNSLEFSIEKTNALSGGIDKLIKSGFRPTSVEVQGLVTELGQLQSQFGEFKPLAISDLIPEEISSSVQKVKEDMSQFALQVNTSINPLTTFGQALEQLQDKNAVFGESFNLLQEQISATNSAINQALEEGFSPASTEVEYLTGVLGGLNEQLERQKDIMEATAEAANIYKNAFEAASSSQIKGFRDVARAALDSAKNVIKAKVQEATAAYFADAFAKFGLLGGILAAGAGAVVGGLFSATIGKINIPALAEGGLVTGPTLALIGEGRENEAVLPLSKLNALIDSGGSRQELTARISGEDIYFLLQRVQTTLNRVG